MMESKKRVYREDQKSRRGKSKGAKRRAHKAAVEEDEERRLTSLLFGKTSLPHVERPEKSGEEDFQTTGDLNFEIDRKGDVDASHEENPKQSDTPLFAIDRTISKIVAKESDDDDDQNDDGDHPAWVDEDDDKLKVDLLQTDRLKKLRKSREEPAATALGGVDFTARLRERYKSTMQRTARTDWARVNEDFDEDDGETKRATTSDDFLDGHLLRNSSRRLPPNLLSVVRCPDANQTDPNSAVVQAVHFHPGSEPDRPLMLTAGLDKTLRFFQVGEEESVKVHGIHCKSTLLYFLLPSRTFVALTWDFYDFSSQNANIFSSIHWEIGKCLGEWTKTFLLHSRCSCRETRPHTSNHRPS